jgi:hypothetical protein
MDKGCAICAAFFRSTGISISMELDLFAKDDKLVLSTFEGL